jgi:hypothetical protein
MHVHQAGQNELVGEINDRDLSGYICRVDKSVFNPRDLRAFDNDRLIVTKRMVFPLYPVVYL